MEKYMRRWYYISACYVRNLHAKSFLKLFLTRFNINVELVRNLAYDQAAHGLGRCH
jgi:hypothetical protein